MSFKTIVYFVTTWIVLSLLCGICEGAMMSTSEGAASVSNISILMKGNFTSIAFWESVADMITFNFPYLFVGPYVIFQWVFFIPLVVAFSVMLALALKPSWL